MITTTETNNPKYSKALLLFVSLSIDADVNYICKYLEQMDMWECVGISTDSEERGDSLIFYYIGGMEQNNPHLCILEVTDEEFEKAEFDSDGTGVIVNTPIGRYKILPNWAKEINIKEKVEGQLND